MNVLYVGSMNARKAQEMMVLLAGLPVEVRRLPAGLEPVDENGATFAENARIKALELAAQLDAPVVADDSGLEVDALGGRPGVYSARYGGPEAGDEDRVELILKELEGVPDARRGARFRCSVALAAPGRVLLTADGVCEGAITRAPRGDGGFGYDPIFQYRGDTRTFAEMSAAEKHARSHRGQALRAFREGFERLLARCGDEAPRTVPERRAP